MIVRVLRPKKRDARRAADRDGREEVLQKGALIDEVLEDLRDVVSLHAADVQIVRYCRAMSAQAFKCGQGGTYGRRRCWACRLAGCEGWSARHDRWSEGTSRRPRPARSRLERVISSCYFKGAYRVGRWRRRLFEASREDADAVFDGSP